MVVGRSSVETTPPARQAEAVDWSVLGDERVLDTFAEFLTPTAHVPALPSAVAELQSAKPAGPLDAAREACDWVRNRLRTNQV